ncbi:MAG: SdpI family protein [Dehalococcoidia bacterium]
MTSLWVLLVAYVGCGLLCIAIALPLVQRRIPPNAWYGFRVERTLQDPAVWYPANAYTGRLLIGVGVGVILVAIVAALVLAQRQPANASLYVAICTMTLLGGLLAALLLGFRYLDSLP